VTTTTTKVVVVAVIGLEVFKIMSSAHATATAIERAVFHFIDLKSKDKEGKGNLICIALYYELLMFNASYYGKC